MRVLALWIVAVSAGVAVAAPPQVEIRAQTQLQLEKVRLVEDGLAEVRGQLLDKLTGDGIGGQIVTIKIGGETTTASTGPDGKFRATITVQPGQQTVDLKFHGGSLLTASTLNQTTDPARAQVALTIAIEDAPGGVKLTVRATADDQPITLPIALSIGTPTSDTLKPLATVDSGTAFVLTRKAAGGPGTRKVRAAFTGDDTRQQASAEATVELSASSTTTMTLTSSQIAYEDDLGVTGKVTDEDDHPLARAAVTLVSGDRRLAQGATAEDGSYKFRIEGEILGQGQFGVQVQTDPGTASIKPSRSSPVIVKVSPPQPVPVSYTIVAFVATALAAGGFFTARAKPWQRFRRPAPPADVPSTPAELAQVDGGLVVAKPGIVSTLRRPSDDGFTGNVRDTVRGRAIGDAVVRLLLGETEREVRTSADGNFAIEKLATGDWQGEVAAPGHVTERFVVSIPHRGELRGVRVDLVPVRERVFQLYRRAAEPILPEPRLWGIWSPRQVVDHVRSRRPSPALADLTDLVEEIYFSARVPSETVLPNASEAVDRAIHERARAAS